ncbi:MAG: hypothetical protein FJ294_03640 [Planctomycetes bacterium]|nr:hypothetical protein [Planctomycetota bacterium]
MAPANRRDSLACAAFVLVAALGAVFASARASSLYGLGVDGDAAWHLSAGASLARGEGLVTCLGEVFSLWPPLYPAVMAALEWCGLDVLDALRVLHLAALAVSIALSARLAWRVAGSHLAAVATAGSLALSSRMHEYTVQVVSETFFLPLVLGALSVALALQREFTRSRFAWLVVLSALACLQRYLGVALVLSVALLALARPEWGSLAQRARRVAVYAAVSLAPLALWFLRNRSLESSWTGGRDETPQGFSEALTAAAATVRGWAEPATATWLGWAVVLGLCVSVAALALQRREVRGALALLAAFAALYATLLVALASNLVLDPIGDRLLLPALPVLAIVGWSALFALGGVPSLAGCVLVALAWLDATPRTGERIEHWRAEGAGGFHTRLWQEHPVTIVLREASLDGPCWSNGPELVWLEKGIEVRFLRGGAKAWERAGEAAAHSGGSLAWFQDNARPAAFPEVLARHVQLEPLAAVRDGLLLRLAPR